MILHIKTDVFFLRFFCQIFFVDILHSQSNSQLEWRLLSFYLKTRFNCILLPKTFPNLGKHAHNIHIKQNPSKKIQFWKFFPQNTKIVFHYFICVHSKYENLYPNNKVTGEFFMSDIFHRTEFSICSNWTNVFVQIATYICQEY